MRNEELRIQGMTCGHCVMSVKKGLSQLVGMKVDEVKIGGARVQYDESKVTIQDIERAVEEAGYTLVGH